jgi:hypothetical protein
MLTEFLLLWCHFIWPCIAIVLSVGSIVQQIRKTMTLVSGASPTKNGSDTRNKMKKSQRRLIRMACLVGALCVIQMGVNIWTSEILDTWTVASNLELICMREHYRVRDWKAYGFTYRETVCEASEVSWSRGAECASACRYFPFPEDYIGLEMQETHLLCAKKKKVAAEASDQVNLDDVVSHLLGDFAYWGEAFKQIGFCDCPCSKTVKPETPPVNLTCRVLAFFLPTTSRKASS